MNDPSLDTGMSDKESAVVSQVLERLKYLESKVVIAQTEHGTKETRSSQTSQSDINRKMLKNEKIRSESYISEMMRTVNAPGTNGVIGAKNCKFHTFLWIFIQTLALVISCVYIQDAYESWRTSPIVIYHSNELKPIKDIKAPAVTICFPTGMTGETSDRIFTSLENCLICDDMTQNDDPFVRICTFSKVCDHDILYYGIIARNICQYGDCANCTISKPHLTLKITDIMNGSLHSYFQDVLPSCHSMLNFTIQVDSNEPVGGCDDRNVQWFVSGVEERQLCMTYNSRPYGNIYRGSVILPLTVTDSSRETTPITTSFNNLSFNFESYGDAYLQNFLNCHSSHFSKDTEPSVYVHDPDEIPLKIYLDDDDPVTWGSYHNILVTPQLITADKDIQAYNPFHRNCYFPGERDLVLYESYSKANCKVECLVNCSLETCGCVPFNLPRPNASVKVCLESYCDTDCDCNCLPDCESLSFTVNFKEKPHPSGVLYKGIRMVVMFKTKEFRPKVRYSLSSFSEFVAYSLGVLGTFNGLSVIALWKLMYLMILRFWSSAQSYLSKSF